MNKHHYLRKSEIALAWSVTWLISFVVFCFLSVVYLKGEAEWVKGWITVTLAIMSAIGCYHQGREASRCMRIHLSRKTLQTHEH